jgi:hypothetical protein
LQSNKLKGATMKQKSLLILTAVSAVTLGGDPKIIEISKETLMLKKATNN